MKSLKAGVGTMKKDTEELLAEEITKDEVHSNLEATESEYEEEILDNDIETLEKKLQEKTEESKEYYDRMIRLQADFTNYKKRVEKEKADIYLYANEKLAGDLLDIIDNLERALDSQCPDNASDGLYEGIELVLKQLKDTLKKHGVEEIEAMNKAFDMNLHHAVMKEAVDNVKSDEIIEVFQKGYTLNGRVLRPSMVKVAQ